MLPRFRPNPICDRSENLTQNRNMWNLEWRALPISKNPFGQDDLVCAVIFCTFRMIFFLLQKLHKNKPARIIVKVVIINFLDNSMSPVSSFSQFLPLENIKSSSNNKKLSFYALLSTSNTRVKNVQTKEFYSIKHFLWVFFVPELRFIQIALSRKIMNMLN